MRKVLINALPKSGTNLVAKCLKLLGYREQGGIGSFLVSPATIRGRVRRLLWKNPRHSYLVGIDSPVMVPVRSVDRILGKVCENGFLSAHVGYGDAILCRALEMAFVPVLIVRDPRAVLASFVPFVVHYKAHALHQAFVAMAEEERYWAAFRGGSYGEVRLASMLDRCMSLQQWFAHDAVVNIRFEDIVGSRGGGTDVQQNQTLRTLCRALELPEERADAVAAKLFGPGRGTFRKGQIASWRDELPDELNSEVGRVLAPVIQAWGYN